MSDFVDQAQDDAEAERLARLDALGQLVASKRDEAVKFRKQSGIEDVWAYCEEAYLGIDDANRAEWQGAKWAKPAALNGPLTRESRGASATQSTVFIPLTARYVDAGAAKLSEIILPLDGKPFSMTATPNPELITRLEQQDAPLTDNAGQPVMMGEGDQQQQVTTKDLATEIKEKADEKAKKAEKRIHDWMVEANYSAEMRKVLHDASRIGVGVLKAPFADVRTSRAISRMNGMIALQIVENITPGIEWVDPWNLFPDPACGEDIHDGDYVIERDFFTARKLRGLRKNPTFLAEQIDAVLEEGSEGSTIEGTSPITDKASTDKRYQVWYYYGTCSKADLLSARAQGIGQDDERDEYYAIVTVVNSTVIRAVINPLDSGTFPYNAMPWRRRSGSWVGVGPGEQCKTAQSIVNAATRAMLTNAGRSAGGQIIIDTEAIVPANNDWTITNDKIWHKAPGAVLDDVRKAFMLSQFPSMQPQMMAIIEYAFKLAEESTNIPLVTQGQSGDTTPDTFGGMQMQNNNANQLLRAVGYQVDDYITRRVVEALYEWLLLDPEVPDDEKGDFQIDAHCSGALIERSIQDQFLQQMGQLVMNPAFGISPERWMGEVLRSKQLNAKALQLTDAEKEKMAQQPQVSPQVQAAQIRAQVEMQKAQASNQLMQTRIQVDTDRDRAYVEAETMRTQAEHQARMAELNIRRELAMLDYANKREITLEQIKADLADSAMKLKVQKELSMLEGGQVATPPTEPAGRALPGHAFEQ